MPRKPKLRKWQEDYDRAAAMLAGEPGRLEWATDDYVAFRYVEDGARLVFYPHKHSCGQHFIRVRKEASKDRNRAEALIRHVTDYMKHGVHVAFRQKNH